MNKTEYCNHLKERAVFYQRLATFQDENNNPMAMFNAGKAAALTELINDILIGEVVIGGTI